MQSKKIFGVISLILFLPVIGMSQAQTFQFNSIEDTQQKTKLTPAGEEQQRTYFELNETLFEGDSTVSAGDFLEIEIRPGEQVRLKVRRIENYFEETVSVHAVDPANRDNFFSFTYHNGGINGQYHESHTSTIYFEHEPASGGNYMAKTSLEGDNIQLCGVHEEHASVPMPDFSTRQKSRTGHSITAPNLSAMGGESLDDMITVDLLIVYTQKAQDYAEGANFGSIEVLISEAMRYSQLALDNSEINVNLRLVHSHKTDYNDDGTEEVEGGDHLRRLTQGGEDSPDFNSAEQNYDGYMEEVHPLREEYGADLVALIASEPNTGGIAWLNNSTAGRPGLAFSVNRAEQAGRTFTLIHEIGHNFGSAHSRTQEESPAGALGGLFKYSVGYQTPDGDNAYNTIMAYNQEGLQDAPYFSDPDKIVAGQPAGSNRANTVLTMRQVKRSIASYRLTYTDPPAVSVSGGSIHVALTDDNSRITVPVPINNNGDSDLMWSLDFDLTSTSADPAAKGKGVSYSEVMEPQSVSTPYLMDNEFGYPDENGVIFETEFEPEDGFTPLGVTDTLGGWRVLFEELQFTASDENPATGAQHLRMESTNLHEETIIVQSPFFGLQPFGDFEISMDIAINQTLTDLKERFDIYVFDGDRAEVSSGVVFSTNTNNLNLMYAYGRNPQTGQDSFYGTQFNYPGNGEYFNLRIVYNAAAASLDYYVDERMVASNEYAEGKKPDYIWFLHFNEESNASIDVDNIEVTRIAAPFSWLEVDRFGGVTQPGEQDELMLSFTAAGVQNGRYETELILTSNDPDIPVRRIPVTVNVDLDEPIGDPTTPEEIALDQNYPNPFNPTTTINYDLDDTYPVIMEVFDITGKKVATLVDREQAAGSYAVSFNGQGLSSGVYIYRLQTPSEILTRKMVLVK